MTLGAFARALAATLAKPSPRGEAPEFTLLRGLSHAVLGGALAALAPWPVVALAYGLVKEGADLRRGGGRADSLFDVAFVALGAALIPWPGAIAAIGLGLVHAYAAARST